MPRLSNTTHRDVHSKPTSYDKLRDRTYQYASIIKATDPTANLLCPSDFGWPVYVDSLLKGDSLRDSFASRT
ncbi:glycoside hydrolase family 44 protein [Microcoleus sp. K4-B3]|uniref:glycoside hydrolase family 44 protein n=1 Tax=Microcoleus sp. K4-C2 TaxID=2818792 RepID=UPI002FD1147E